MNNSNSVLYLIIGFFTLIMIFLFVIVYQPTSRYTRGKYLQALHPSKLSKEERWSRERTIEELEKERTRRKMINRDIYS